MDFNTHSMRAHFHDLERQVKPQLTDYQPSKNTLAPVLRVVSVVGLLVAVGLFLPLT